MQVYMRTRATVFGPGPSWARLRPGPGITPHTRPVRSLLGRVHAAWPLLGPDPSWARLRPGPRIVPHTQGCQRPARACARKDLSPDSHQTNGASRNVCERRRRYSSDSRHSCSAKRVKRRGALSWTGEVYLLAHVQAHEQAHVQAHMQTHVRAHGRGLRLAHGLRSEPLSSCRQKTESVRRWSVLGCCVPPSSSPAGTTDHP